MRKRKHYYYDDHEDSEDSDSYVREIRRRPKNQKKRIIYEDEIDGLPEYEPHSPTEDEEQEEEQDNYKIQTKSKKRPPAKQIEKPKQLRKGITKSIKMLLFVFFISCNLNVISKMQKAISNKIQLRDTLNPLDDYGGVPSINDEGTLENLIGKVDKV